MEIIPKSIKYMIFSYLSPKELSQIYLVNKFYNQDMKEYIEDVDNNLTKIRELCEKNEIEKLRIISPTIEQFYIYKRNEIINILLYYGMEEVIHYLNSNLRYIKFKAKDGIIMIKRDALQLTEEARYNITEEVALPLLISREELSYIIMYYEKKEEYKRSCAGEIIYEDDYTGLVYDYEMETVKYFHKKQYIIMIGNLMDDMTSNIFLFDREIYVISYCVAILKIFSINDLEEYLNKGKEEVS